ncbi:M15 family metallopeptidase [Arthrobacter sp. GMC3]|uniref:M15 family metallopeptidase n=1 Tax=Arthrobacter sp. GMC3 TaxID=2058894 RepID=UPI002157F8D3|nr:D-alanyl-D-alanine carboxypeptidase family protein [Arthrobacter sp. GMC3]
MPDAGSQQAHRPRRTRADRLRATLSWPNPAGILISIVGSAVVFMGAMSIAEEPAEPSTTTASSAVSATLPSSPESTARGDAPTAQPESSPSTITASPMPQPTPAPLIQGASSDAPIQQLFATGTAAPTDRLLWNIANPTSPLVLVNKHNPMVPADYLPADLRAPNVPLGSGEPALLRSEAAAAVGRMFAAASADGVHITIMSSFRSYETQSTVYNGYLAQKGQDLSDTSSARPGFSEHQTGFALDIGDATVSAACEFTFCMADSPAGKWVAAHGADYGFVIRYPMGEEPVTGYAAEPWHLRFLGIAVAQDMSVRGISSYEAYLGVPAAPDYK